MRGESTVQCRLPQVRTQANVYMYEVVYLCECVYVGDAWREYGAMQAALSAYASVCVCWSVYMCEYLCASVCMCVSVCRGETWQEHCAM